ncbi:MAG: MiaB/RimO family radical SAM methylthiotransferase, partial [Chloroflexota bacterium]
ARVSSLAVSAVRPPGNTLPTRDGFRVRSFVKAQEGCDDACAYCIVPRVRGKPVSLSPEEVVRETAARAAEGYQEVVITGTKIGSYGYNGAGLTGLVESLLRQTRIPRLRLSSLQPREVTPQLLSLWNDRRLCPHFHLALQSGSQRVLESMGRPYSIDRYRQTVSAIHSALPYAAITTDIIAGFPGETDDDFDQTYRLCRELGFAAINVFPYSPRPSTQAALLPGRVDERTKRQRAQAMLDLAAESREKFRQRFLGREMTVLWERETSPGVYSGLTENSIRVTVQSAERLTNRLTPTRLMSPEKGLVWVPAV